MLDKKLESESPRLMNFINKYQLYLYRYLVKGDDAILKLFSLNVNTVPSQRKEDKNTDRGDDLTCSYMTGKERCGLAVFTGCPIASCQLPLC